MPELPQIPAIIPSSIPAQDAIGFPATWFTQAAISAPDPAGKKSVSTTSTNYNAEMLRLSPLAADVQSLGTPDLDADAVRYPEVAATMGAFLTTLAKIRVVWWLRGQLAAASKSLADTQAKLADFQTRLVRQQAMPEGPAKTEVLPDTQQWIARLTAQAADGQAVIDALTPQMAVAEAALGYVAPV